MTEPSADARGASWRSWSFASKSTREELAAGGMMVLGFVLASGLALGGLAFIVMIMGG